MKRMICALSALVMAVCLGAPAFAAQSSVTVKNNVTGSKPVSYTYDPTSSGEIVKSIKTLMTKLDDITKSKDVVQTLTVTSDSDGKIPVDVSLRISLPAKNTTGVKPENLKTPSPDEFSALDYYNLVITTSDGTEVYNYADADDTPDGATYKEIPLGTFNTKEGSESRIYNLAISINKSLDKTAVINTAEKLDWSIVTEADETRDRASAATDAPASEASPSAERASVPADAATSAPAAVPTTEASPVKSGTVKLNSGEYVVGTDIDAGRYTMTGEGKVHVYTNEDILKTTVALKAKNDNSSNGVAEYVINLSEGEKVKVDSQIELAPFKASSPSPSAASSAKPTTSPSATATAKPSSSSSSSSGTSGSSSASSSSKTNPKTGDNMPLALVSIAGLSALAGVLLLAARKKKDNR